MDEKGVRVPNATNKVTFTVEGPANLLGIENGDLNDPDTGKDGSRSAFHGRGLAILQSKATAGTISIQAKSPGLESASVQVEVR